MATREERKTAKKKMETAEAALQDYVNRSFDVDTDPVLFLRLTEELRKAQDQFVKTLKKQTASQP
jgi:hypothetical protein